VAEVARRHGMNANQLFAWRQLAKTGTLRASSDRPSPAAAGFIDLGTVPAAADGGGKIEVELPSGVIVRAPVTAAGEPLRSALVAVRAAGL
jgi:transposase-like protein